MAPTLLPGTHHEEGVEDGAAVAGVCEAGGYGCEAGDEGVQDGVVEDGVRVAVGE